MDGLTLNSGDPNALNFTSTTPNLVLNQPGLSTYDPTAVLGANTYAPTGGGASGTSYTAGVNDPATLAAYQQAIANTQSGIDRTGTQLSAGNTSLDNQYNTALQQLLLGYNQSNQAYGQNKQTNATNYVGTKNTIGANAGSTLNGLLRLLGSRGAGGSSAYNIAAPQAVAGSATLQRNDAGNTFGLNQQALDQSFGNYQTGYNNQVTGVGAQRDQGKASLANSINSNKASLLQTLAQLQAQQAAATGGNSTGAAQPYLDQANALLDQTANYTTPQINYQTQAYNAPSLASYTNPQGATPTYKTQAGGNDYFSPYLSALLGKKQPGLA